MNEIYEIFKTAQTGQLFFTSLVFGSTALIIVACIIRDYLMYGKGQ